MIISLFDYTGEAVKPWRDSGHDCICFDIQHNGVKVIDGITYAHAKLSSLGDLINTLKSIGKPYLPGSVKLVLAFPPCTDLAVSGAKHWKKKRKADPEFQTKAVNLAQFAVCVADYYRSPYVIENPVGALSTLWRKPNVYIHPYEFGGYILEREAEHPTWPDYIAPRDAYTKKTGLWYGNGFCMPSKSPVDPIMHESAGSQSSKQWSKLGGKSLKTKNIRSATPRGLAIAIKKANEHA